MTSLILLPSEHHHNHDSKYPSFLTTIQESSSPHSFPDHEYVTSLITSVQQLHDCKLHSLSPLADPIVSSPRSPRKNKPRTRQLTAMSLSRTATLAVEPGPHSPPDLTNSKSSKSSSFHSSSLPDVAGPHDISNFEDITLDDSSNAQNFRQNGMSNEMLYPGISGLSNGAQRRLLDKRPSMSSLNSRTSAQSINSFRDLTNSTKRPFPGVQGHANGMVRDQQSSLGLPTRPRRGFTSPSQTSLSSFQRSRSPSPASHAPHYRSSSRSSTSSRHSSSSTLGVSPSLPISRRTSWQSGAPRKTVKELEAEYDDNDNDLPDDAFIFNLPITPRMPHERPNSTSASPQSGSPMKIAGMTQYLALKHQSAPPAFPERRGSSRLSALSDKSPSLSEVEEDSEIDLRPIRQTSYSSALSTLDEDARVLTSKFERELAETERQREAEIQNGQRPISLDKKVNSWKVELPPVQRPSMMMDPLPMSKEKEAALSRTRPSHLPPKSKEEEEKHLKQYKKMMAAAQEAEKKRVSKLQADLVNKDLEERSKVDVWKHLVLPNWDEYRNDKRTRELWWRGIPPAVRGRAWMTAIGNELELTQDSFKRALEKGSIQIKKENEGSQAFLSKLERLTEQSFPDEKLFQKGMPMHEAHHGVLLAYCSYRPDVNLFPGVSHLAALLVLNLDIADAFISLANILNRPLPMAFLLRDGNRVITAYENVLKLMHIKMPHLYTHLLEKLQLHPDNFLGSLFESLFCGRMSLDHACRVWDAVVFEGDRVFTRAAVGTLRSMEGRLYGAQEDVLKMLGRDARPEVFIKESADEYMHMIREAGKMDGLKDAKDTKKTEESK